MKKEDLERLAYLKGQLKELQILIDSAYDTRRSPALVRNTPHQRNNYSITEQAMHRLESLRERQAKTEEEYFRLYDEALEMLDSVQDTTISAIIIFRFICGYSWPQTTGKVKRRKRKGAQTLFEEFCREHPEIIS